jgi:hypothetical protein
MTVYVLRSRFARYTNLDTENGMNSKMPFTSLPWSDSIGLLSPELAMSWLGGLTPLFDWWRKKIKNMMMNLVTWWIRSYKNSRPKTQFNYTTLSSSGLNHAEDKISDQLKDHLICALSKHTAYGEQKFPKTNFLHYSSRNHTIYDITELIAQPTREAHNYERY